MLIWNRRLIGFGLLALALSLTLWNCNNTEVGKNTVLNLTVPDSLSFDKGNYDSIRVDLLDSTKILFRAAVFQGTYITTEHPGGLHLNLGENIPATVIVSITGHRKDGQVLVASIEFENGKKGQVAAVFDTTPSGVRILPDGPVVLPAQGDPLAVSAQVLPLGAKANVIWTALDTNMAKFQNGFVIPREAGLTRIIATLENTVFKDTLIVTVTILTRPDSVRLNTHLLTLPEGAPDTLLVARVSPDSLQAKGLVWQSSNKAVATVSSAGVVNILSAGKALISVNPTGFSGISDTCQLTVTPKAPTQPESLILNIHSMTLFLGESDSLLLPQILPTQFQSMGTIWSSSDSNFASVSPQGKVKAKATGKTRITAAITGFPGILDTCSVTIMLKPKVQPDSIQLIPHVITLTVGKSDSVLQAKIFPDSMRLLGFIWKSNDTSIATVDGAGRVKAISEGKALLTVIPTGFPLVFDTCRVTILPKPISKPDSIRINTRSMVLYVGGPDSSLTTRIYPDSLTRLGVVWKSHDTTVAKVVAGKVHAITAGNAYIIASTSGFPEIVDTCRVTVKKDVPTLTTGPDRAIVIGGQLTFNLKVVQEFGGVSSLKWDLDGDNVFDDSLMSDTASPKHTYPAPGNFTAHFYVRDGEGNIVTSSLTVHVGNAPLVIITSPVALDTTVNTTPILVKYTVNGTSLTRSVVLQPGPNPTVIDSITVDGRGYDSLMINLDTTPPSSPTFTGISGSFTTSSQPLWQWTSPSGGGGNGTYRIQLDGNSVITQTTKSYQPAALSEGAHTLTLQERDVAGNWSSPPASFIWKVDLAIPTIQFTAPVVTGNYLTKSASVHVAGTASDAMGLSSIIYVLTGATVDSALATGTTDWAFDKAPNEGTTTIKVIAKDFSGRTATASITLTSDRTRPSVTLDAIADDVKITSKDILVAGSATDAGGLDSTFYRINAGSKVNLTLSASRFAFTPSCPDGDCSVMVFATDKAGNRDSQTVVIHKMSKVIFVRKGRTGGDGSSWAKAYGELSDVMNGSNTFANKRIWVSEGSYIPNFSANIFYADNSAGLIGGFKIDGTQYSESQRSPFINISELSGRTNPTLVIATLSDGGWAATTGFTLDGFKISNAVSSGGIYTSNSTDLKIRLCQFIGFSADIPLYVTGDGTGTSVTVINSRFTNNILSDYAPIHVGGASLTIDSSSYFENNVSLGGAISSFGGTIFARNSTFKNDLATGGVNSEMYFSSGVAIDIDKCSITNGQAGILGSGTVIYGSSNITLAP